MLEQVIFSNLIHREEYGRKVIPFLKREYFHEKTDQVIFELIDSYVAKYNRFPTIEALSIDLTNKTGVETTLYNTVLEKLKSISYDETTDLEWVVNNTEKFCQEKAVYNAIMDSIQILDNKDSKHDKGSIPQILSDALGVSFDTNIGHNWLDDADLRYEFYHRKESRVPFDLEYFNKITKGGLPAKTLSVCLASTGTGKSLFMCHCAANNIREGKNVLYITLEMAEERIAERIDANIMDVTIDELHSMDKTTFDKKMLRAKNKTSGKLIIKEYPTSSAGSANFRHLINELKLKKNFIPDIIYIDYLNICSSSRIKYNNGVNSYTYVKAIAEELRGLAVEFNVPIFSATQTTRSGIGSSDVDITDTSESIALPATVDFLFALISTEELQDMNQIMVKQLKNRYNDPSKYRRFVIGVDRSKMKLYDVEHEAQEDIIDGPVMDKTEFGNRENKKSKFSSKDFEGFV
jgi:archaellum biogenesis ATPase FlaH